MKKVVSLLLALIMAFSLVACGEKKGETDDNTVPYKIGIVTGSVSQSEDDRRGAEAFQKEYGEDMVQLAIYPDGTVLSFRLQPPDSLPSNHVTCWN